MNGHLARRLPIDRDLARIRAHEAHDHIKRGGFACPIGPKQPHHLALRHGERHIFHHLARTIAFLQATRAELAQRVAAGMPYIDRCLCAHFFSPPSVVLGRNAPPGAAGVAGTLEGALAEVRGLSTARTRPLGAPATVVPLATLNTSLVLS